MTLKQGRGMPLNSGEVCNFLSAQKVAQKRALAAGIFAVPIHSHTAGEHPVRPRAGTFNFLLKVKKVSSFSG